MIFLHRKKKASKDEKEIKQEIMGVIRQITASVTFLPLLETACESDLRFPSVSSCIAEFAV